MGTIPQDAMAWIAGWFPILSLLLGFSLYYWFKRAWIPTVLVFGGTLASMLTVFTMKFWSWLLLYLFLCWFASWAANMVLSINRKRS